MKYLSKSWWLPVFLIANILVAMCVVAWADRPYIDVPASRLNLVIKEFRLVNDDNGIPFHAEVKWLYKSDLGDIVGSTDIGTRDLWQMWNASRAGWNLDQLTDFMISYEAKRKGLQIQGSVSNVIPFALAEINVYTNVVYTDSSSNTVDRFDISYETNLVYKSLSGDLQ